jgi:hypothetical protein
MVRGDRKRSDLDGAMVVVAGVVAEFWCAPEEKGPPRQILLPVVHLKADDVEKGPEGKAKTFSHATTRSLQLRSLLRWLPGCFAGTA